MLELEIPDTVKTGVVAETAAMAKAAVDKGRPMSGGALFGVDTLTTVEHPSLVENLCWR